jgi:NADH-quinone oxidoreductase subunit E
MFSWTEVECLGACVNAPMVQINKDYYEDLTPETFEQVLVSLREGRKVKPGPQDGRHSSEPFGGATTLIDPKLYAEDSSREVNVDDVEFALVDDEAKKPSAAASRRESPVPKRPLGDSSGKRRK